MSAPTIWCDLIKVEPLSYEQYADRYRGFIDPQTRYRNYRDGFQPWRIVVISGDNSKSLFRSTERYFNEADARHAVELAFGNQSNVYLRQAEHGNVELRLASGG